MCCDKKEIWRYIPNFPNYVISSYGRLYSYKNNKLIKPTIDKKGYLVVTLQNINKSRKQMFIHQLVLLSFKNKNNINDICRHYPDPNPKNNKLCNLHWGTYQENVMDEIEINEVHHSAKLSKEQVVNLKHDIINGLTYRQLMNKYNISEITLYRIKTNKTWKGVGPDISQLKITGRNQHT